MQFELSPISPGEPRALKDAPVVTPLPRSRRKKLKSSFIAAAKGLLAAANSGSSTLASRWQLALQKANAGKR